MRATRKHVRNEISPSFMYESWASNVSYPRSSGPTKWMTIWCWLSNSTWGLPVVAQQRALLRKAGESIWSKEMSLLSRGIASSNSAGQGAPEPWSARASVNSNKQWTGGWTFWTYLCGMLAGRENGWVGWSSWAVKQMGKENTGHEVALYIVRPAISDDSMKDSMVDHSQTIVDHSRTMVYHG